MEEIGTIMQFLHMQGDICKMNRSESDERLLIKMFITSLDDREIAKQIFSKRATCLDEAISRATNLNNLNLKMSWHTKVEAWSPTSRPRGLRHLWM